MVSKNAECIYSTTKNSDVKALILEDPRNFDGEYRLSGIDYDTLKDFLYSGLVKISRRLLTVIVSDVVNFSVRKKDGNECLRICCLDPGEREPYFYFYVSVASEKGALHVSSDNPFAVAPADPGVNVLN